MRSPTSTTWSSARRTRARRGRAAPSRASIPRAWAPTSATTLLQEIEIRGAALVAEEKVGFGTTPSLTPAGLVPKPYALRLFVTATSSGFAVMPGGLAMTVDPNSDRGAQRARRGVARRVGGRATPVCRRFTSLWRPTHRGRPRASARRRTCRAAPPTTCSGSAATPSAPTGPCACCASASAACRRTARRARSCAPAAPRSRSCSPRRRARCPAEWEPTDARLIEQLARNLMTSADWYYGLPRTLDNIHRVASITRDRLSLEAWRTLNDFYASRRWRADAMPTADRRLAAPARRRPARAGGLPWPHAREHDAQLRLVVPGHGAAAVARRQPRRAAARHLRQGQSRRGRHRAACSFTLELADSFITYRSRYRLAPMLPLVLDLLLVDESNPRSIAFQLAELVAPHRFAAAVGRGRRAHRGAAHGARRC